MEQGSCRSRPVDQKVVRVRRIVGVNRVEKSRMEDLTKIIITEACFCCQHIKEPGKMACTYCQNERRLIAIRYNTARRLQKTLKILSNMGESAGERPKKD